MCRTAHTPVALVLHFEHSETALHDFAATGSVYNALMISCPVMTVGVLIWSFSPHLGRWVEVNEREMYRMKQTANSAFKCGCWGSQHGLLNPNWQLRYQSQRALNKSVLICKVYSVVNFLPGVWPWVCCAVVCVTWRFVPASISFTTGRTNWNSCGIRDYRSDEWPPCFAALRRCTVCAHTGWLVRGSLRLNTCLTFRCWNCQHASHMPALPSVTSKLLYIFPQAGNDEKPHKSWHANITYWDCLPDLRHRSARSKTEQATKANQHSISGSQAKYVCPCCKFDLCKRCSCWRHVVPKMHLIGLS